MTTAFSGSTTDRSSATRTMNDRPRTNRMIFHIEWLIMWLMSTRPAVPPPTWTLAGAAAAGGGEGMRARRARERRAQARDQCLRDVGRRIAARHGRDQRSPAVAGDTRGLHARDGT